MWVIQLMGRQDTQKGVDMKAGHTNLLREKQIFAGEIINMPIVDNFFSCISAIMRWESEGYGTQKHDKLSPNKVINNPKCLKYPFDK
jgi:hypothetical protein